SMLNLAMIAALNRMHEWELHLRGAIRNGVSPDEIQAILHQVAVYCGVPVGVECFRIARKVFAEESAT
ncbi:MAG: carboxymuconolactone decarboxylase family protein, partial [Kiloniellales bacterium]|nr:carboxymuconolactone decarboxylase family protein [Kiloniellales bacterium]